MKSINLLSILIFSIFLVSCGTQKKIVEASGSVIEQSVQDFWKNYEKQIPDFKAIQINSRINADIKGKGINASLKLYIENGKKTWLNASMFGFTGARALIEPNSVKAYEVLDKTYIDANFNYLNSIFNVDFIDYEKFQQLLLGQLPLLSGLNNYRFSPNKETGFYALSYKKNKFSRDSIKKGEYLHTYFLDSDYRLRKIEITNPKDNTQIIASYDDWVQFDGKNFPSVVKIMINTKEPSSIELDYNNFTFEEMQPPFKIPSSYSKRDLK